MEDDTKIAVPRLEPPRLSLKELFSPRGNSKGIGLRKKSGDAILSPRGNVRTSFRSSKSSSMRGSQQVDVKVFFAFNTRYANLFRTMDNNKEKLFQDRMAVISAECPSIDTINERFRVKLNADDNICFYASICCLTDLVHLLKRMNLMRVLDMRGMKRYVDDNDVSLFIVDLSCDDILTTISEDFKTIDTTMFQKTDVSSDSDVSVEAETPRTQYLKEVSDKVHQKLHEESDDDQELTTLDFRSPRSQVLQSLAETVGDSLPGRGIDYLEPDRNLEEYVEAISSTNMEEENKSSIRKALKDGMMWLSNKL